MARRLLPVVLLLSACASTPEYIPNYYAQCVNDFGYTLGSPEAAGCAERLESGNQARRMAAFSLFMQNPPLKWHNVQQMPAPIPIGPRTALPCRQVGNQVVCNTQ
ncbi:hypothetical protein K0U83_23575 [bacterium]|nr:hypothetical protein [bacterium]